MYFAKHFEPKYYSVPGDVWPEFKELFDKKREATAEWALALAASHPGPHGKRRYREIRWLLTRNLKRVTLEQQYEHSARLEQLARSLQGIVQEELVRLQLGRRTDSVSGGKGSDEATDAVPSVALPGRPAGANGKRHPETTAPDEPVAAADSAAERARGLLAEAAELLRGDPTDLNELARPKRPPIHVAKRLRRREKCCA